MKPVTANDVFSAIEMSEESMADTFSYDYLPNRSCASPYDFFVQTYSPGHPDCKFEYDTQWDEEEEYGDGMNGRGCDFEAQFDSSWLTDEEQRNFWAAFFNSGEDLNTLFWKMTSEDDQGNGDVFWGEFFTPKKCKK